MFVKFPCFPGVKGMDAGGTCRQGMPEGMEDAPRRHQAAIQAVSDACGFSNLKSRTWNAPVYGTTPEVSPARMSTPVHAGCCMLSVLLGQCERKHAMSRVSRFCSIRLCTKAAA